MLPNEIDTTKFERNGRSSNKITKGKKSLNFLKSICVFNLGQLVKYPYSQ